MGRRRFSAAVLRLCLIGGLLAIAPGGRLAAGDDASDLVAKLRKKYDKTATLSAAFTQTTVFAVSKARQSSQGTIALAKGNRYRIAYDDRVIVCDGATVWSWSKGNGQVVVDRFREDPNGLTPERLLAKLPEEYTPSLLAPESIADVEVEVVKMTPSAPSKSGKQLRWLKLWIDEDRMSVVRLQTSDLAGNETTYDLRETAMDRGLPDSTFRFTPPPGAEVLDLR